MPENIAHCFGLNTTVKYHDSQNLGSLLCHDAVAAEEGIEVSAVDVDFAAYPEERDNTLVAVVLPYFVRDSK